MQQNKLEEALFHYEELIKTNPDLKRLFEFNIKLIKTKQGNSSPNTNKLNSNDAKPANLIDNLSPVNISSQKKKKSQKKLIPTIGKLN